MVLQRALHLPRRLQREADPSGRLHATLPKVTKKGSRWRGEGRPLGALGAPAAPTDGASARGREPGGVPPSTQGADFQLWRIAQQIGQAELDPAAQERNRTDLQAIQGLDQQTVQLGTGLPRRRGASHQVHQITGRQEPIQVPIQPGTSPMDLRLGQVSQRTASGEKAVQLGKRLDATDQGTGRSPRTPDGSLEAPPLGGKKREDLVGLAQGTALQDQEQGLVESAHRVLEVASATLGVSGQ